MGPVVMIQVDDVQSYWEINSADEPKLRDWCKTRGRSLDPNSLKPTQAAPGLDYPKDAEVSQDTPRKAPEADTDPKTKTSQDSKNDMFSMNDK